MKQKKKTLRIILLSLGIVILLGGAGVAYMFVAKVGLFANPHQTSVDERASYKKASTGIANAGTTQADIINMVAAYGPQYDAAYAEVQKSNPSTWDSLMVDKAFMCVLYANKIKAASQVETLYYKIQSARDAGISVDSNNAGVTKDQLQTIFDNRSKHEGSQ